MSDETKRARLDRRLDTLSLPVRVTNWAERRGVETLVEVARLHPRELLQERNMGRTSIAHVRQVIRAEYGLEWEDLWEELRGQELEPVVSVEPSDASWDLLRQALPDWLLAMHVADLDLPTRIRKHAERSGLLTIGELVAIPRVTLESTKNIGAGSIGDTRRMLIELAGADTRPETGASWNELASTLPDWLLATPLSHLDLAARMRGFVDREGLAKVADLVAIPRATLQQAKNLGRRSLEKTHALLVERAASPPRRASDSPSFWALWLERLGELDALERMIVTQRCGIHGESRTLVEIGETLGVSRERVRQIESRALTRVARGGWVEESLERLRGALEGGALGLDELEARDPWLAIGEDRREAFGYFLERIAGGALAIATIEGRDIIAACSPEEVAASVARARAALEALACPADSRAVAAALAGAAPPSATGLATLIGEALEARIHRDAQGQMRAFGKTRDADVLAFLRQCAEPVTIHEVHAAVGGRGRFPDEVFYFERGVVGLQQHFPDYPKWKRRLVPICVRIMEEDPRQWRVPDLLESVREDALLPESFGHWNLAEILRRSPEVRYLGRLRVALPGVSGEERVRFSGLTQRILTEHGAPLRYEELLRRVNRETMVATVSFRLMVIQAPFVQVDEERIGLLARDVPGGFDAITRFGDALEAELSRSERGLSGPALAAFVTRLSEVHARWTLPMARGVLRTDPRFQLSRGGGGAVGLAEWDDVRVPTRAEVARACVDAHGGRAPISAVLASLHAHHGARLDRRQLGALAFHAGLRMRGDELVIKEPPMDPPAAGAALPELALESRPIFEALLEEPPADVLALLRALDEHVAMFARAEAEGAPVEAAEAAFLRERCRALLTRELAPDDRRLAQAAVRYFLLRDDADSDLSAGGLDDDDAVIGAVELHLARP